MKNTEITKEEITEFFKRNFSELRNDLKSGEEMILLFDENTSEEDSKVIAHIEFNGLFYSNEEILKMLDS